MDCGGKVFKEAFPQVFGIVWEHETSIADHLEFFCGSSQWKFFYKAAQDRDVDAFTEFLIYFTLQRREQEM